MTERIPEGWLNLPVAEVFEIGRGRVISKDEMRENIGTYPVFSSQSFNNGEMGRINSFDFEGEYVTWTTDGAYAGTVFYRNGKFSCTNVCGTLRDSGKYGVDMKFVAEYLSTVAKQHVSYVGNPKLMNGIFGEINLLIPPLPEQKKIASILTSVDELIEKTQLQINKLQDLKKGTMNVLLTKGIGHTEFKDSELGRIPKSWEVKSLSEITLKIGDGIHSTPKYSETGKFPFINGNNLLNGEIYFNKSTKMVNKSEFEKHKTNLHKGTLLLSINGTIGNLAFYKGESVVLGKSAAYLIFIPDFVLPFAYYLLSSDRVKKFFDYEITGTTIRNLSLKSIKNTLVGVPSTLEQQKISDIISSIDLSIKNIQNKLSQTQSLKKSLMQDLLTGRVRVTVN